MDGQRNLYGRSYGEPQGVVGLIMAGLEARRMKIANKYAPAQYEANIDSIHANTDARRVMTSLLPTESESRVNLNNAQAGNVEATTNWQKLISGVVTGETDRETYNRMFDLIKAQSGSISNNNIFGDSGSHFTPGLNVPDPGMKRRSGLGVPKLPTDSTYAYKQWRKTGVIKPDPVFGLGR